MHASFRKKAARYLSGDLSPKEKSAFEQELKRNPALSAEFDELRGIVSDLETEIQSAKKDAEVQATIEKIGQAYFGTQPRRVQGVVFYLKKYGAVAAILLTLICLPFLFHSGSLYDQYAQHPEAHFVVKGDNTEALLKAQDYFNAGQYEAAKPWLETLLKDQPDNLRLQFYYGIALLETGQTEQAGRIFQSLASDENSPFRADARWYLALTRLKEKDYAACREHLRQIAPDSPYYEQAQKLLKALPS
ncbi:MAG: hypothetical protein D6714_02365 [Bacteroidetes bacterium]|nr:MAG: hypothetical protein D6714_02365 [Bacteroidota bacterium]